MNYRTPYQKVADGIIDFHPLRKLHWHNNRLFWHTSKGWLELVVGSSGSWFRVDDETSLELDKLYPTKKENLNEL